tara:strand:+ start:1820 stop:1924 length:105 start_codon:yes stop_codon:yes gene_type:complete
MFFMISLEKCKILNKTSLAEGDEKEVAVSSQKLY